MTHGLKRRKRRKKRARTKGIKARNRKENHGERKEEEDRKGKLVETLADFESGHLLKVSSRINKAYLSCLMIDMHANICLEYK